MAIEVLDERQVKAPPKQGVERQVHVSLKQYGERFAIDIRDYETRNSVWSHTGRGTWLPIDDGTAMDVLTEFADLLGMKLVKKAAPRKPAAKKAPARKRAGSLTQPGEGFGPPLFRMGKESL